MRIIRRFLTAVVVSIGTWAPFALAHPGDGLIVTQDGSIYFTAVHPIQGPQHHGCVWKVTNDGSATPFYKSSHFSSNIWIVLGLDGELYGAERHYLGERDGQDVFTTTVWRSGDNGDRRTLLGPAKGRTPFGGPAYVVDARGVLICAAGFMLRKRLQDGSEATFVGGAEGYRDGTSEQARFGRIFNLAWGPENSIFVLEKERVRVVQNNGEVRTLIGGLESVSFDMEVDAVGNVLLADWGNRCVLQISSAGERSTLFECDSPWAPEAVALHGGLLYVLETTGPPATQITPRIRTRDETGNFSTLIDFSQ